MIMLLKSTCNVMFHESWFKNHEGLNHLLELKEAAVSDDVLKQGLSRRLRSALAAREWLHPEVFT